MSFDARRKPAMLRVVESGLCTAGGVEELSRFDVVDLGLSAFRSRL